MVKKKPVRKKSSGSHKRLTPRNNPVRFNRARKSDTKPPMAINAALTRMALAAKKFNTKSVTMGDIAPVVAVADEQEACLDLPDVCRWWIFAFC
jgi:hypothetical protein